VYINKKALLLAILILGAASEAFASDYDGNQGTAQITQQLSDRAAMGRARAHPDSTIWRERASAKRPSMTAPTCPWLEGYPDCR
jgi:hypothetical protein